MPSSLTNEQVAVLRTAHRTTKDKRLADRIKAVLSLHAGYSYEDIAQTLLLDEVTLRRHVKQFQEKGLTGLLECHYRGGMSQLTFTQEQQLTHFLSINTQRTAKEIVDHIQTAYRVKYTVVGVTKLLHRLGFSYKKPKTVPGKVSAAKQLSFLAKYEKIKTKVMILAASREAFLDWIPAFAGMTQQAARNYCYAVS